MFSLEAMKLGEAFARTLRSRRFWVWQIGGAVIYAIPATIRYATGDVVIPLLVFQFFGYFLLIPGPHGGGNLFESIHVFPINFVLASLSIFPPDVVYFAKSRMENVLKKFSKRLPEDSQ